MAMMLKPSLKVIYIGNFFNKKCKVYRNCESARENLIKITINYIEKNRIIGQSRPLWYSNICIFHKIRCFKRSFGEWSFQDYIDLFLSGTRG